MRRRELLTGSGLVVTTALAGCLGRAQDGAEAATHDASKRTITVSASGESVAEPDLARLRLGVESTGDDAAAVRSDLATRAAKLEASLLEYGLEEDDLTTDRFRIRERYDHDAMRADGVEPRTEAEAEEYRYYVGTHSYSVDVHDVDDVGDVIRAAVDDGEADEVGRIEFTLSADRRDELRDDALEEALEDARAEADFVATEVDASIVDAQHVDTSGADVSPVRERFERAEMAEDDVDAEAPGTELRPDDVTVRASVTVKYEMA